MWINLAIPWLLQQTNHKLSNLHQPLNMLINMVIQFLLQLVLHNKSLLNQYNNPNPNQYKRKHLHQDTLLNNRHNRFKYSNHLLQVIVNQERIQLHLHMHQDQKRMHHHLLIAM